MYKYLFNNQSLKDRRRELRRSQTEGEAKLWQFLRGRKLAGLKFNRQFSIGPYILDFYCPKLRLGIELDGGKHTETETKILDQDREKILRASNVKILRFWNDEIMHDIEKVLETIRKEIGQKGSLPLS